MLFKTTWFRVRSPKIILTN